MKQVKTFVVGIILGIANVIPGVSGGTMAVVLNVYDRIIDVISLDVKKIRRNIPFLAVLSSGLVVGVLLFAKLASWLFELHPVPTAFFFVGIIIGSIPFILKKARGTGFKPVSFVFIAVGIVIMVLMVVFNVDEAAGSVQTILTVPVFLWLFAMGIIGAITMLIPGVSGSFILLILGAYYTVIQAISDFNIPLLIPVGLGIVCGLLVGASLVRFLLSRAPGAAYCIIFGLVLGSLLPMFPGLPSGVFSFFMSFVSLGAGIFLSWFFSRSNSKKKEIKE